MKTKQEIVANWLPYWVKSDLKVLLSVKAD